MLTLSPCTINSLCKISQFYKTSTNPDASANALRTFVILLSRRKGLCIFFERMPEHFLFYLNCKSGILSKKKQPISRLLCCFILFVDSLCDTRKDSCGSGEWVYSFFKNSSKDFFKIITDSLRPSSLSWLKRRECTRKPILIFSDSLSKGDNPFNTCFFIFSL